MISSPLMSEEYARQLSTIAPIVSVAWPPANSPMINSQIVKDGAKMVAVRVDTKPDEAIP